MSIELLQQVSNAVTDKPVTLEVNIDPQSRLHKLLQNCKLTHKYFPKKKELTIYPSRYGTLMKISALVVTIDEETIRKISNRTTYLNNVWDAHNVINKYGETLIKVTAMAIHNKESDHPRGLERLIRNQFTAKSLLDVLVLVLKIMDTRNFMLSIISTRGLSLLEMNPQTKGSTIAPGNLSDQ